ncbi:MAG: sensor histidine kinase, partial [Myxococcota bacterium]
RMLEDATGHARVHVVDEEGRTVFGQPTPGGVFTVGRPFETTLYGWRLYATLTRAEELGESVERRRELEMIMVAASFLVVAAGVIIVVVAAERERRLAALKSEFVANVSHELKTPLSLVRMFSELLATGRIRDDAKRQQYLSIIMRESERLSALIENVLDFARVERGKAAYNFEEANLGAVIARAVDVYRYRIEREGMEVTLDVEPDLPRTVLDERALELALVNLMDNAIKYAKDGGRIHVAVRLRGARTLEIRLTDHGPGIPKEEQKRIFERFVRGKGARERQVRGSGIGLALVQHIARSHGGQVWVESDLGKGSQFILTIPVRGTRRSRPSLSPESVPVRDGGSASA